MKLRSVLKPLLNAAFLLPVWAFGLALSAHAQQNLPWQNGTNGQNEYGSGAGRSYVEPGQAYDPARNGTSSQYDGYQQSPQQGNGQEGRQGSYDSGYDALRNNNRPNQGYQTPQTQPYEGQGQTGYDKYGRYQGQARQPDTPYDGSPQRDYQRPNYPRQGYQPPANSGPGQAYAPPGASGRRHAPRNQPYNQEPNHDDTYSDDEILDAGHRFFGKVTKSLAKVIAHVFKKSGRPNAYILGEEGGGALIAGLRYGEGTVYTKTGQRQRVYWQGPSIGYDFGAEGAKTMILVYNLRDVNKLYARYAGIDGSAYLVGGVGVTFQKRGRVVLAPIRSGVGVRLGANVGYLKYTRRPTWNPF